MSRRYTYVSDLTGKVIDDEKDKVEIRVISHPLIDQSVKLDAFALEVQSLLDKNQDLVTLEVVLNGEEPIKLLATVKDFEKLFTNSIDDVLGSAEQLSRPRPTFDSEQPKRRGRPPRLDGPLFSKPKRDPQQLAAIRDWWRSQGNEIGDRGRIPQTVEDAYNEAHKTS